MDQKELEMVNRELEALDADGCKVVEMLSTLPRVEAPGNFEFRVKAGIASREGSSRATVIPFFKVAAPLALVLLVGTFAIFYGSLAPDTNIATGEKVPQIEQTSPPPPRQQGAATRPADTFVAPPTGSEEAYVPSAPAAAEPVAAGVAGTARRSPMRIPVSRSAIPVSHTTELPSSADPGNSGESASTSAKVIDPPGINSNLGRSEANSNSATVVGNLPVGEVLKMLGMETEFAGGGWTVRSVSENSVASRAGVKSSDLIEAMNDQPITEGTILKNGFEGKTIRVRRDGKQITIGLQN